MFCWDVFNQFLFIESRGNQMNETFLDVEQQTKTDNEPTIQLSIKEAEYALKCIRYLASGFDFELSDSDTQNMWNLAEVIYRRVEKVK